MTERARVALVTGASSGIGRAIALELARAEYDLVITARRRDLLEALAEQVRSGWGRRVEVIAADLGTRAGCETVEVRIRMIHFLVDHSSTVARSGDDSRAGRPSPLGNQPTASSLGPGGAADLGAIAKDLI